MTTFIEFGRDGVSLELVKKDCLACRRCSIGGCRPVGEFLGNVFSNMNMADIMVVGQNPGVDEVIREEPFVGASGKVFNDVLKSAGGIGRERLYLTNVVKCYTPDNRKPSKFEIDNCREYLDREVEIVRPKVAIALGSFAFKALTGMSGIMKNCGEVVFSPRYRMPVVAFLHPSPGNMNNPERREMFDRAMKAFLGVVEKMDSENG